MWRVFVGLLVILAIAWVGSVMNEPKLELDEGNTLKIEAKVNNEPIIYWDGRKIINLGGIEVQTRSNLEIMQGDRLRVVGKVKSRLIKNNTVKKWLEADHIVLLSKSNEIQRFGQDLREKLRMTLVRSLPQEEGALMVGLVWGDTSHFSGGMREMVRVAGLSHIVAASGFNVTLLAGWASIIAMRLLKKWLAMSFVVLCILLYMYLAGLSVPIIRAGAMAIVAVGCVILGKQAKAWYILILIVLVMIVLNSRWIGSISFQLSVMATAAIIYGSKGDKLLLMADFKNTIWIYLFTLPILVYHFGIINIWGPIANVLVLWIVPLITQLGMIASFAGIVSEYLSILISYLSYVPLRYILEVSNFVSKLPASRIEIGEISGSAVIIYYIVLASICIKRELH